MQKKKTINHLLKTEIMKTIEKYLVGLKPKEFENKNVNLDLILKEEDFKLCKEDFLTYFKHVFKELYNKELILDKHSQDFLLTLINYFYQHQDFFKSSCLNKNLNNPSLGKGLLIIGNPGLGKSKFLKAFEIIFKNFSHYNPNFYFIFSDVNDIVTDFESLETSEKDNFFQKQSSGFRCYDDVKSERQASNFGIVNLMQDILQHRYNKERKTIIICNYTDNYPNNLQEALNEFGIKYGSRIYDRLFEMFNIIEVKGLSKRN